MSEGSALVLHPDDAEHRRVLEELRADPCVAFVDTTAQQLDGLRSLAPAPADDLLTEPTRWVFYPWRRAVVRVLGPSGYRRLRLDRNRNQITLAEQDRLSSLTVGVVGLSVGHAIAHMLAAEGVCGALRLADFDHLELSNLNRVPATVFDLGVNKATAAARRIAEMDPYLDVREYPGGLTPGTVDEFLDGLDVVVEECDSLDLKILVRTAARARGIPVLMATSDRGLFDVERFDTEPDRPILHGLLGDIDLTTLTGLSSADKVPYVLRVLDASALSARTAASMVEIGETLETWPQRAGDVAVGAAAVAEAVRKLGLREDLASGRVRMDVGLALENLDGLSISAAAETPSAPTVSGRDHPSPSTIMDAVADAAVRAPSGGNSQPWHLATSDDSLIVDLAPEYTSTMDVGLRGSAVAVGAAAFNARVAAAAHGRDATVEFTHDRDDVPLRAAVRLHPEPAHDLPLARLYQPMLRRGTNRRPGRPAPLSATVVADLTSAAQAEGARLTLLTAPREIERAATILAAADRIRFLTQQLHIEMMSELRWPDDPDTDTGIDVLSLDLSASKLHTLEILRRPDVMAHLAEWDVGAALGEDMFDRVVSSSALAVVTVGGASLADYARGGCAVESVWIHAQERGLAVHPVSPAFLYARTPLEMRKLSATFDRRLDDLQRSFHELTGTDPRESLVLVLRMGHAAAASMRSRRRQRERRSG